MRMIIVDRDCGYIFADIIANTPIQAIEYMDKCFGVSCSELDVYQVEDDFPPVDDGTNQNLIETLEKSGKYIASIAA